MINLPLRNSKYSLIPAFPAPKIPFSPVLTEISRDELAPGIYIPASKYILISALAFRSNPICASSNGLNLKSNSSLVPKKISGAL